MTYRDYLAQSDFSEIWKHLENIYKESTDIKETYQRLYGAAKELPRRETSEEIRLETDYLGEVKALNTLDTQEELIDRAVVIGNGVTASPSEVAAHLLYWSSIYGSRPPGSTTRTSSPGSKSFMPGPTTTPKEC